MEDRIRSAFDDIRADEALVQKTAAYLQRERGRGKAKPRPPRSLWMAAAVLALVAGALGYRSLYATPASYVSFDVNPSVELALNRLDIVIDVAAYSEESGALLRGLALRGKQYDQAAASLLRAAEEEGYLRGGALVTLTVQTADRAKEQALCDTLLHLANTQLGSAQSPPEVEVFPVEQEVRESAQGCHMSAAKYLAIQELMEVDETATLDEYSGSTIRQIRQRTQACRMGGDHESAGNGGSGQGKGHHDSQQQGRGPGSGHGHHGGR